MVRCGWCGEDPLYVKYHDEEWGRVIADMDPLDMQGGKGDRKLFEFLTLEGAQAGLSWITILRKREGYRKAFRNFEWREVAKMEEWDVERLMNYDGIVKNRLKIESVVNNARRFAAVVEEFGSFYNYVMTFLPDGKRIVNDIPDLASIPVTTPVSDALSKDLKRRGFKFVGSTICYSFLQATGFIDDHLNCCDFRSPRD